MDIYLLTADEYRQVLGLRSLGVPDDAIAVLLDVPLRSVQKAR